VKVVPAARARQIAHSLISCALCLVLLVVGNIVPRAAAQQVSFRSYGAPEGLSNAWFACLVQDKSGFIFTCTEHGLYAYDGRHFANFGPRQGLPDGGIVEAMATDAARRIVLRYSHQPCHPARAPQLRAGGLRGRRHRKR
jgi:hypothetical protein